MKDKENIDLYEHCTVHKPTTTQIEMEDKNSGQVTVSLYSNYYFSLFPPYMAFSCCSYPFAFRTYTCISGSFTENAWKILSIIPAVHYPVKLRNM